MLVLVKDRWDIEEEEGEGKTGRTCKGYQNSEEKEDEDQEGKCIAWAIR